MLTATNDCESICDSVVHPDERLLMDWCEQKERQALTHDEDVIDKFWRNYRREEKQ